jgi:hypothetical protein
VPFLLVGPLLTWPVSWVAYVVVVATAAASARLSGGVGGPSFGDYLLSLARPLALLVTIVVAWPLRRPPARAADTDIDGASNGGWLTWIGWVGALAVGVGSVFGALAGFAKLAASGVLAAMSPGLVDDAARVAWSWPSPWPHSCCYGGRSGRRWSESAAGVIAAAWYLRPGREDCDEWNASA